MSEPTNNEAQHRFEIASDGEVGFLTYRIEHGVVVPVHTEVPKPISGRGIAAALARGKAIEQFRTTSTVLHAFADHLRVEKNGVKDRLVGHESGKRLTGGESRSIFCALAIQSSRSSKQLRDADHSSSPNRRARGA